MKRQGFTLIELMIVIAIIGILASIAIPNFRRARMQARQKACFSNQKVLMGAIEMYNMDNQTPISSYNDSQQKDLLAQGYLKSNITKQETSCELTGEQLDGSGVINCKFHGNPEEPNNAIFGSTGS